MILQTKIRLPQPPQERLHYGEPILTLGSCFSEHIGRHLERLGHHITVNPFGTVYNPLSIVEMLRRLGEGKRFTEAELFPYGGLWHSSLHHGSFSKASPEASLEAINQSYDNAVEALPELRYLLLTWGSAWIYQEQGSGEVVSNCHKRPETDFERRLWSPEELVAEVLPVLRALLEAQPQLRIITTISPIRHLRDGAHGNQLSKATLLLMDERLRSELGAERYLYFPAYEILLDELRDYRFYAEDMAHPSEQAQRYIAELFAEWLQSSEASELSRHVLRLRSQLEHRPLHPEHPEAELKRSQLELLLDSFRLQHPDVRI